MSSKNGKISSIIMEEEKIQTFDDSLPGNAPILVITDLNNLNTFYINKMPEVYCGISSESFLCSGDKCFFEQQLHPDDYPVYLEHLKSLQPGESKEIIIRVKDTKGNWNKFTFKDRIYNYDPTGSMPSAAIGLGYKVDEVPAETDSDDIEKSTSPGNQYKFLLNSIDECYCIIEMIYDRDQNPVDYIFCEKNPAFEKQTNLLNVTGRTMKEIEPALEEHWFKTYGAIAINGDSRRFQEQAKYFDNSWLDVYAFKIGGDLSRKVAVLFHDITERVQAEQALIKTKEELEIRAVQRQEELTEKNQLLQTVFDTVNQAIAVFKTLYEPDGSIKDFLFLRVNKTLEEMYLSASPLGKTYLEISKYGKEMGIFDAYKEVMRTGIPLDKEIYFNKEGYNHWFRIIARPQDSLLIASVEDITSKKAKSQQLREAIRFKKQLVQTSPDTIVIVNLNEYNIQYINQDMLARAGMTKKRILGMTLPEIMAYIHPRDRQIILDFHKKILKSSDDQVLDCEFRVRTKESDWEWFSARGKIFNRRDKKWVDEYVILIRNITQQKNTQRALINAERLSIQGEVARTFAHELRNPLASIRMAGDVIKNKMDDQHKALLGNYMEIMARSTRVLNNLVSNLLDSSNYSSAKLEKTDLAICLEETIYMAADRIYLTGIKVIKKFKGPYYIMADKEKLKIALLNIIVNASEATPPDEGIIEFSIKKHKTDFLLSITDNGHGLEKEQIDKLFDAFYTNKATGVGIGLNSVINILQDHDAKIKVSSKPNVGTTFNLYFHNADLK